MNTEILKITLVLIVSVLSFIGFAGVLVSLYQRTKAIRDIQSKVSKDTAHLFLDRFPSLWGENTAIKEIKKIAPHTELEIDRILKSQKLFYLSLCFIAIGCICLRYFPFDHK